MAKAPTKARKGPKKFWPAWRYGPAGESQVFDRPEDVPAGWEDHPSKHTPEAKKAKEAALRAANKHNVLAPPPPVAPAAKQSKEQKAAAKAEAAEAYRLELLGKAKAVWPNTPDDATTAELEANLAKVNTANGNGS
jgi:hypothetical protein